MKVVYEDTAYVPQTKRLKKNILNGVFLKIYKCTKSPVRAKFRSRVGVGQ